MQFAVADLIRAWKLLGAEDPAVRARIAGLLGFAPRIRSEAATPGPLPPGFPGGQLPPFPPPPDQPVRSESRSEILVRETVPRETVQESDALGVEGMETVAGTLPPFPHKASLLSPRWQRGIFSALLSVSLETGEVDTGTLIDEVSRGERLKRIPWRSVPSLSLGVRCFLDTGPGMQPFLDDQAQLVAALRLILRDDCVSVGYFESLPDEPDVRFQPGTERAASPFAPVLVVSDFGVIHSPGRRWALPQEWLDYFRRERQRGAAGIFAMSPFGRARLPKTLRGQVVLLEWDRGTSVRTVLREGGRLAAE